MCDSQKPGNTAPVHNSENLCYMVSRSKAASSATLPRSPSPSGFSCPSEGGEVDLDREGTQVQGWTEKGEGDDDFQTDSRGRWETSEVRWGQIIAFPGAAPRLHSVPHAACSSAVCTCVTLPVCCREASEARRTGTCEHVGQEGRAVELGPPLSCDCPSTLAWRCGQSQEREQLSTAAQSGELNRDFQACQF